VASVALWCVPAPAQGVTDPEALRSFQRALQQDPTRQDPNAQDPGVQDPRAPGVQGPARHPLEINPVRMSNEDPFQPGRRATVGEFQTDVPEFVGFPIFPPDFSGWSGHPTLPSSLLAVPDPVAGGVELPLIANRPDDWPSWIRMQLNSGGDEFSPDRAMLIRDGDRVWYRDAEESAFEPLASYERVRVLRPGSRVQVRTRGSYQVSFHGGSRLVAMGRSDVLVDDLDAETIAVRLYDFSRVWVYGRDRRTALALPDGSVLTLGVTAEGEETADVYLERDGRMAFLHNAGPGQPDVTGPFGSTKLPPGHRIGIALEARVGQVRSAAWRREGELAVRSEGASRVVEGAGDGAGGAVEWSGARVRLPVGARVEINPLGGVRPAGPASELVFPEMRGRQQ